MNMNAHWQLVCESAELSESGPGVRFTVGQSSEPGFVIRVDGHTRAFLNRCGHVPVELDWPEGHFLDEERTYIRCATHGAIYDRHTGACMGGPCRGRGLTALQSTEADGQVWVAPLA